MEGEDYIRINSDGLRDRAHARDPPPNATYCDSWGFFFRRYAGPNGANFLVDIGAGIKRLSRYRPTKRRGY